MIYLKYKDFEDLIYNILKMKAFKKRVYNVGGGKAYSNLEVAKAFNMLPADEVASTNRTAITNATVRSVFLIDPEKKIRMMLTYPMTTGRNFDEILRVLDSIQLTSKTKVATPVNWKKGDEVIIIPAVSDDEAKKMFDSFTSVKPYLRYTKLK